MWVAILMFLDDVLTQMSVVEMSSLAVVAVSTNSVSEGSVPSALTLAMIKKPKMSPPTSNVIPLVPKKRVGSGVNVDTASI